MIPHLTRYLRKHHPIYQAKYSFLEEEIGQEWLDRLGFLKITPDLFLDLGSRTPKTHYIFQNAWPRAQISSFNVVPLSDDPSFFLGPHLDKTPFEKAYFDGILLNGGHLFETDPTKLLSEMQRILKPGGFLAMTTLGPNSFQECRDTWSRLGVLERTISPFQDMHDWGDLLAHSGWQEPVVDRQDLTLIYPSMGALLVELKGLGAAAPLFEYPPLGIQQYKNFQKNYTQNEEGYPITLEIVYAMAWKPAAPPPDPTLQFVSVEAISKKNPFG